MRSRRYGVVAALLTVVLVVGCAPNAPVATTPVASAPNASAPAAPSATAAAVAPARWTDCGNGFLCSTVVVPKVEAEPALGTLNIALIRLPATDPAARLGSLVINPGGPGGSGVEFVRESAAGFPPELRKRFDLVGFDPRGVNASSEFRCIDNLDGRVALDPSPDSDAELTVLVADSRAYARACGSRNDQTLAYLSTDAVVGDLDRIRQAIGDEHLTYLGFSYGTLIGALYAERFPDRMRAMVLDGAIDPSLPLEAFRADQAVAFERSLTHFLADCADDRDCVFHGGGDTTKAFDLLMTRIEQDALPTPRARDRRSVGPGLAQSAVLGAMYDDRAWPTLAAGLALAELGDGSLLLLIADPFRGRKENGSYSNQQDAYTANICLDYAAPTDVATYTSWAAALEADAPHFAKQVAYNDLTCAFWPVAASGRPHAVRAPGAPPLLVIGSTGDPATPFAWSEALVEQLSTATLITREGEGHTAYFKSRCVARAVDAYLLELTVPRAGLRCD